MDEGVYGQRWPVLYGYCCGFYYGVRYVKSDALMCVIARRFHQMDWINTVAPASVRCGCAKAAAAYYAYASLLFCQMMQYAVNLVMVKIHVERLFIIKHHVWQ